MEGGGDRGALIWPREEEEEEEEEENLFSNERVRPSFSLRRS